MFSKPPNGGDIADSASALENNGSTCRAEWAAVRQYVAPVRGLKKANKDISATITWGLHPRLFDAAAYAAESRHRLERSHHGLFSAWNACITSPTKLPSKVMTSRSPITRPQRTSRLLIELDDSCITLVFHIIIK